ncbi:unnamed protein product [Closterium sp. Naga37s-1]|nr:unnamed protein product [Closterium sp. Naga37s-1]
MTDMGTEVHSPLADAWTAFTPLVTVSFKPHHDEYPLRDMETWRCDREWRFYRRKRREHLHEGISRHGASIVAWR